MSNFKKRKKTKKAKKISLQNNKNIATPVAIDLFPIEKIDLNTIPFSFKARLIKRKSLSSSSNPFFSVLTPPPMAEEKKAKMNCLPAPILSYPLPEILDSKISFRRHKRSPLGEKAFINSDCLITKTKRVDQPVKEKVQIYGPKIVFHHRKKPTPKDQASFSDILELADKSSEILEKSHLSTSLVFIIFIIFITTVLYLIAR